MSRKSRRRFTPAFKAQVVLEAVKERHTLAELAMRYEITSAQIASWKRQLDENAPSSRRGFASRPCATGEQRCHMTTNRREQP